MILKVMQHIRFYARFTKHKFNSGNETTKLLNKSFEKEIESAKVQQEKYVTDSEVPIFSKIQCLDANLNSIMLSVKSRKRREKNDRILLEGKRLIRDAVETGVIPEIVFFSRVDDIKDISLPESGVKLYKVPYKTISLWSDTSTCPGIMAIFKIPQVHLKKQSKNALPLTVVCDNVRDPGNLGAILRVAAGVGCEQLLVTKGCVDLWEPKVLRSAAGAHFRLPIHRNVSLNMLDNFIRTDSTVYLADNNATLADDDEPTACGGAFDRLIPILPYHAVDFTHSQSLVLVIGGETEGLSDDAMRLAGERQGARLHIPLTNGIESLNTASALSVILFEIKRQLCTIVKTSGMKDDSHSQEMIYLKDRVTLPNS